MAVARGIVSNKGAGFGLKNCLEASKKRLHATPLNMKSRWSDPSACADFDVLNKPHAFKRSARSFSQTSHYPSDFQATGTTETIGTIGTALPLFNDFNGPRTRSGLSNELKPLILSPFTLNV